MSRTRRLIGRLPRWLPTFGGYLAFCSAAFGAVLLTWYIQSFPENAPVPWPTFAALDTCFKERSVWLADVLWHVWLVDGGYEVLPAGADLYARQHNWAYFPLTAYAGKLLVLVVRDTWWSLQIVTLVSVAAFMTLIREEVTSREPQSWSVRNELVVVLFVLPIGWPCINFTVLPMLVEFALFFSLLRLARAETVGRSSLLVMGALALAVGFSRPQGLLVLAVLAATALVVLRARRRDAFWTAGLLLLPILLVLGFYKWKVGEALAFYHVQRTWGRSLSWPWTPWIKAIANGHLFAGFHDVVFSLLRAVLTLAALVVAAYGTLRERPTDEAGRRARSAETGILAASSILWLLPSMTGILLGMHRLYSFATYPLVSPTSRNPAMQLGSLLLVALCLVRMVEVACFFQNRYFAIW